MAEQVLWVGGLPKRTEESDVRRFLKAYGNINKVTVRSSPVDVFCFVTFAQKEDAMDALNDLDGKYFNDSDNKVRIDKANRPSKEDFTTKKRSRSPSRRRSRSGRRNDSRGRSRSPPKTAKTNNLWMGGLPRGVLEEDIKDFLKGHGKILDVRIRSSQKDIFAFATFESRDSVLAAVQALDQAKFLGTEHVIQLRESATERPLRDFVSHNSGPPPERRRSNSPRYGIELEGLPPDMEWMELKDISRKFGDSVVFTNVFKKGKITNALIHYKEKEDAEYALKKFDNKRMSGQSDRLRAYRSGDW